ncbi:MAG: SurA N-terminal domain-containing protein [Syntrophobacteraceae bacterium]
MLDFTRKHAKSWLVKVIFGVIILSFVAWGGYSYTSRHENDIAKVGEHYISRTEYESAYRNMVEAYRQQFGKAFSEDLLRQLNVRDQTLELLIERYLVVKGAAELGVSATTDEIKRKIRDMPAFQSEGGFSKKHYEALLRQERLSPDVFEQQVADTITQQKVQAFIRGRAVVTENEILLDHHFNRDQLKVAYVIVDPKPLEDQVTVSNEALQTSYQNNQNRYMEPEKREISYVLIDREALEREIKVSDDEIKRYYDDNLPKFAREKQVHARHILFKVKPDASPQEVEKIKGEARKVLDESRKGKDFAELAKKYSQDEGSAKKGGDLGFFGPKQMVAGFSEVAFSLKPGEISELARTQFGFHIIKSEEMREARTAPMEEVKAEIEQNIKAEKAQDIAFAKVRDLRDLAYARKDIDKAAQELKLTVTGPTWIEMAEQADPGPFSPQIKAKLFQLGQGDVSDTIEVQKGLAVAQLKSIQQARPFPFESVKDKVTKDYKADQAKTLAQKKATEILTAAREKKSLAEVAKSQNLNLKQTELFSRHDPDKDLKLLRGESLNSVFGLQESSPFPETPLEFGNRFVVAQFQGKNAAGPPAQEEKDTISAKLLRQKESALWQAWMADMKRKTEIVRKNI